MYDVMMAAEFEQRMRELVREYARADIPVAYPIIADRIIAAEPAFVREWALARLRETMRDFVQRVCNHDAMAARRRARDPARIFGERADAFTNGDITADEFLSPWTSLLCVNDENDHKPAYACNRKETLYVAGTYKERARQAQMEAAFHCAIAKKMNSTQIVADVMAEDDYLRLYRSIIGEAA